MMKETGPHPVATRVARVMLWKTDVVACWCAYRGRRDTSRHRLRAWVHPCACRMPVGASGTWCSGRTMLQWERRRGKEGMLRRCLCCGCRKLMWWQGGGGQRLARGQLDLQLVVVW